MHRIRQQILVAEPEVRNPPGDRTPGADVPAPGPHAEATPAWVALMSDELLHVARAFDGQVPYRRAGAAEEPIVEIGQRDVPRVAGDVDKPDHAMGEGDLLRQPVSLDRESGPPLGGRRQVTQLVRVGDGALQILRASERPVHEMIEQRAQPGVAALRIGGEPEHRRHLGLVERRRSWRSHGRHHAASHHSRQTAR